MASKPIAILRCKWKDHANAQPTWPDNAYTGCFLPIRPHGVARYWQDSTFGLVNLQGSVVFPWRALDLDRPSASVQQHVVVINAIEKGLDSGFSLDQFACVIVIVIPTLPVVFAGGSMQVSTRGRQWWCCLFTEEGNQDYFAHEVGHVLGFDHSWGGLRLENPVEYEDPYCVMSAQNYGTDPDPVWVAAGDPAMPVHPGYWQRMAPSPAGATLYQYIPEFTTAGHAVDLGFNFSNAPQRIHLHALDTGRKPCVAVVTIPGEDRKYTVEYRRNRGWDRAVEPAVVMHSIGPSNLPPPTQLIRAVYEGRIPVPHKGDSTWRARSKKIAVLLDDVEADGSAVDVMIGSVGLVDPLYVAIEFIEGGNSELAEEGYAEVFVPPNCGEKRFRFSIDHQDTVIRCTASAPGFDKPEFSWSVNGVPIIVGTLISPTLSIPVVARFPRASAETTESRIARLKYEIEDDTLILSARSQDGNYLVDVAVTAKETDITSGDFGRTASTNGATKATGVIVRYETAFYEAVLRCASKDLKDLIETYTDRKLKFVREDKSLTRNIAVLGQWQRAAATKNPMLAEQIGEAARVLTNLQMFQARHSRPSTY